MIFVAHTIDKKPDFEIQFRYALESYEERTAMPANIVRCHPSDLEKFAGTGMKIVPDLKSKMIYWLGKE